MIHKLDCLRVIFLVIIAFLRISFISFFFHLFLIVGNRFILLIVLVIPHNLVMRIIFSFLVLIIFELQSFSVTNIITDVRIPKGTDQLRLLKDWNTGRRALLFDLA